MALTHPRHLEACVCFRTEGAGVRLWPVPNGYRAHFHCEGHSWSAAFTFPGRARALPGDTVTAVVGFATPEAHAGRIEVGLRFTVRQAGATVADGHVLRLLDLAAPAGQAVPLDAGRKAGVISIDDDGSDPGASSGREGVLSDRVLQIVSVVVGTRGRVFRAVNAKTGQIYPSVMVSSAGGDTFQRLELALADLSVRVSWVEAAPRGLAARLRHIREAWAFVRWRSSR